MTIPRKPQDNDFDYYISLMPDNANILDYGCFGWKIHNLFKKSNSKNFNIFSADLKCPVEKPDNANFIKISENGELELRDDTKFDIIFLNHVLEHVNDPVQVYATLSKALRPGGLLFIEAPSDTSLYIPSSLLPDNHEFMNFYDDPTHRRPWPPAALYRLAISHGMRPLVCGRVFDPVKLATLPLSIFSSVAFKTDITRDLWSATGYVSRMVVQRSFDEDRPIESRYLSLETCEPGVENALELWEKSVQYR